jgi:hypothetical protein
MAIEYISDAELEGALGSNRCVVVLYSFEGEYDLRTWRMLDRIANERNDDVRFYAVNLDGDKQRQRRHSVTAAPIVRIFMRGNPVAQMAGVHARDQVARRIDEIVNSRPEELSVLTEKESEVRVVKGEWTIAITSGILAGAVFRFALLHLSGVLVLMVPASAAGFLIFNDNFRFSWEQKATAIGLMLAVGFLRVDFLR